ncbi:DUF2062 domain-containing protein [Alkalilacustris brevis]|uniref:DUF2062 domain-containing protein n=1 Tax=Alkalilacustris brevis TaxID=2026338 RepID=UPI001EE49021|nr:DUF2062 domain-containing protein [Alkalilacustris brevis]
MSYMGHRLSRLPDTPERIARGIAAGMMSSFTPFFGLHFIFAALFARAIRGNILAALLGTFLGNPFTFPIIAEVSVQLGAWILGQGGGMHFPQIMAAMGYAWAELWYNFVAIVTGGDPNWFRLRLFFFRVFLPYMTGCLVPGLIVSTAVYFVSVPLIRRYQTRRRNKLRERFARSRQVAAAREAGLAEQAASPSGPKGPPRGGSEAPGERPGRQRE